MTDRLQAASTWLAAKQKSYLGQSVTYLRGSRAVGSSLTATYGSTVFEQDSQVGIVRWEAKDFIFTAADLTIDSVVVEPANGDKITDHNGNEFEVLGLDGTPCFRYSDPYRKQVRVHTKQVGT